MGDTNSCEIFANIFARLAKNPTDENKTIARETFDDSRRYDFADYEMECDDALIVLGLAKRDVEGDVTYVGDDGFDEDDADDESE